MLAPSRAPLTDDATHRLSQQEHPAFHAGVDAAEARELTTLHTLRMFNRRIDTTPLPNHRLGYSFGTDREKVRANPASAIPNAPPTADILAKMARPDLPPKMFGL